MNHHLPPEPTGTKTCDQCGEEMAATSPRAEEIYMPSDGPEGVICLCASCARNVLAPDAGTVRASAAAGDI